MSHVSITARNVEPRDAGPSVLPRMLIIGSDRLRELPITRFRVLRNGRPALLITDNKQRWPAIKPTERLAGYEHWLETQPHSHADGSSRPRIQRAISGVMSSGRTRSRRSYSGRPAAQIRRAPPMSGRRSRRCCAPSPRRQSPTIYRSTRATQRLRRYRRARRRRRASTPPQITEARSRQLPGTDTMAAIACATREGQEANGLPIRARPI